MNASFTKHTFKPDTSLYHTVIFLADKLVKLGFDTVDKKDMLIMEKRGLEAKLILKYVDVMKQKVKEDTLLTWKQLGLEQGTSPAGPARAGVLPVLG